MLAAATLAGVADRRLEVVEQDLAVPRCAAEPVNLVGVLGEDVAVDVERVLRHNRLNVVEEDESLPRG